MNILITGSAGRIGRHIYVNLIRSHHVVGFDISPCSTVDHVGDIRDPIAVKKALEGIDVVVNRKRFITPARYKQRLNCNHWLWSFLHP